jgi:alpha-galactosidase
MTPSHTLLRLEGRHACAIVEFAPGRMPTWRHWGARLHSTALLPAWSDAALLRQPNASMDRLDGMALLPCFGNALSHTPAFLAHHDGVGAVHELVAQSYTHTTSEHTQTLVLHLVDNATHGVVALQATLTLTLHTASDVLSLHTTLHNLSTRILQVDRIASATVPVAGHLQDVGSLTGLWANEFQWQRTPLGKSGWRAQNRHGRSSHETPPACFAMEPTAHEHAGEVVAAHLAWSGNHFFALDPHDNGASQLQAGEWFAPGEVRLAPGASLETPPLLVTWSAQGINGASANLHRFARERVLHWHGGSMQPRPVHLNTWEAVYFNHDDAVLRELATRGAALGVERFVLDDGWFLGRPHDRSGLGDWWPDPDKYPQGLAPLIAHVRALGMSFGLWVEPEMVNPDSALFRAHPDWVLQSSGRSLQTGRYQLVLNIASPEVSDYLFDKLDTLLTDNAITYLKWDMNRDLAQAEDAQGRMAYGLQVRALYALLARLRAAHPSVEIESCASGGGRMDLGILQHTHRFWTSDNNDAVSRTSIQSGAMRLFPLEVLGAHVGPAPAHCTGRAQSMDFRCAVALFGHMGVEADVRKLSADDTHTLTRWIALHKHWRGVLHHGVLHQGTTANGVWWLVQHADKCILGVFTVRPPASLHHAPVRLPVLRGAGMWRARLEGCAGHERARGEAPALWLDALQSAEGVLCTGDELCHLGLPVPNMNPESALVFSLSQHDAP